VQNLPLGHPFLIHKNYNPPKLLYSLEFFFKVSSISLGFGSIFAQGRKSEIKENIPLDSIRLSDPCILADKSTSTYYMTGTGGLLWKSKDLSKWTGPYVVTKTDSESWMGPQPMIWAAELHQYKY